MWSSTFRSAPLTHFSFYASWFSSTRVSQGFKVGRNPILFVVLLMRLSWGLKVGRDPLSFVVLFPVQLIPLFFYFSDVMAELTGDTTRITA